MATSPRTDLAADERPPRSIKKNLAWTLAGNVLVNGAKWLMLVLLTRRTSATVVGDFSLALAVVTPISTFLQLGLRIGLVTDAADRFPFATYHAVRLASVAVTVVVSTGAGLLFYGAGSQAGLIALVGVGQAVTMLRDLWTGLASKHERMDVSSTGDAIEAGLSSALFALALVGTASVHLAVLGLALARLATLVCWDIPRSRRAATTAIPGPISLRPSWQPDRMARLLVVTAPVGVTVSLIALNSSLPRLFIESVVNARELGYFAAVASFALSGQLIVAALGSTVSPRLARLYLYPGERRRYGVLAGKTVLVGAALAVAAVVTAAWLGEPLLGWVYLPEYAAYSHILVLLMVAAGISFLGSFLGVAVTAARFFPLQTALALAQVGVTAIACAALVPRHGLVGAAWAIILATTFNTIMNAALFGHVYRRRARSGS